MSSEEKASRSRLKLRSILGMACLTLGVQELLAWAQFIPFRAGWLMKLAREDWMEPFTGVALVLVAAGLAGPGVIEAWSGRDAARKKARRGALVAALVAGMAALFTIETLIPSFEVFGKAGLGKTSRQVALVWWVISLSGFGGFFLMRRRDVGFRKLTLPIERTNEIWQLTVKADVSFRALSKNEEAYRMVEQRLEFVQAEVGAKFDQFCEPLIQESADLATIDSTARLQMDVGHVFKRYADFHRRLAAARQRLCEDVREAAYRAVQDLLQNELPGQDLRLGSGDEVKISVSHPVLADTLALKQRRSEWDETLRTVVHTSAETGNRIVGEWIERAARGEVSATEVPLAVQALQALCERSGPGPEHAKVLALGCS